MIPVTRIASPNEWDNRAENTAWSLLTQTELWQLEALTETEPGGHVKRITICEPLPTGVSLKDLAICEEHLWFYFHYIIKLSVQNQELATYVYKKDNTNLVELFNRKLRHNQSSLPLLTFCVSSFPVSNMKLELPGPLTLDCPDCNPSAKTWRRVAVEFARGHPASEAWLVAADPKKYSASPQRSTPPLPMYTHKYIHMVFS